MPRMKSTPVVILASLLCLVALSTAARSPPSRSHRTATANFSRGGPTSRQIKAFLNSSAVPDVRTGGGRIAYGNQARPGQFPGAAYILMTIGKSAFSCTGTLISPKVVLTAAHCVVDRRNKLIKPENILLKIGVTNKLEVALGYRVQRIVTPRYKPSNNWGDVALLQLNVAASAPAQPVALAPPRKRPVPGSKLTVFGWGDTDKKDQPERLNYATVEVPTFKQCRQLRTSMQLGSMPIDHFCIGPSLPLGTATCLGDSGGAFLAPGPVVMAVTSFGPNVKCGAKNNFDIATSIPYWRDWLDSMIAKYNMNG